MKFSFHVRFLFQEARVTQSPISVEELSSTDSRQRVTRNMTITDVREQDEGRYTCRIEDHVGNSEAASTYLDSFKGGHWCIS